MTKTGQKTEHLLLVCLLFQASHTPLHNYFGLVTGQLCQQASSGMKESSITGSGTLKSYQGNHQHHASHQVRKHFPVWGPKKAAVQAEKVMPMPEFQKLVSFFTIKIFPLSTSS